MCIRDRGEFAVLVEMVVGEEEEEIGAEEEKCQDGVESRQIGLLNLLHLLLLLLVFIFFFFVFF